MVNIDRNGYSDLLMRMSCARFARSSSAKLQSELLSRLPGLRIHRVAVILADALDEEEPARPVAVGRDLVGAVRRDGVALTDR